MLTRTNTLLTTIAGLACSMTAPALGNPGAVAKVAGEAAAGAIAGELIAMAKGSKYAGLAKGRANAQPDTDSDTIGWLAYHTLGLEFQINLDIDIRDQRARSLVDVDYSTPLKGTWDSWLLGEIKGYFIKKVYDASAGKPRPRETNPQFAYAEWAMAMDGQVVFGPYRDTAGTDPLAKSGPTGVSLRKASDMPATTGTATLTVSLAIVDDGGADLLVMPALWDDGVERSVRWAGFIDDAPADVEPLGGTPVDFEDLEIPPGYTVLYDLRFVRLEESVLVPRVDGLGVPYTDEEIMLIASDLLFDFDTARPDATVTRTTSVGTIESGIGAVEIEADYSIPFAHPSWEPDRTFYCPDWSVWVPRIEAKTATIDDAWDAVTAELTGLGETPRYGNFRADMGRAMEAAAADAQSSFCGGADLTGTADPANPAFGIPDGLVDANDFFYFLDAMGRCQQGDPDGQFDADLTGSVDPNHPGFGQPDGQCDAQDFFYYLDLFQQGCP